MIIGKIFAITKLMKFSKFMFEVKICLGCSTSEELFHELGGESSLGIKFRTFRALCSGQIAPSSSVFGAIFSKVPSQLRKDAVLAYFAESVGNRELVAFISKNLSVDFDAPIAPVWNRKRHKVLSVDQMKCIGSTAFGIRVFQRIMCHGFISSSEILAQEGRRILDSFVNSGLVRRTKEGWVPVASYFRFPHPDFSPHKEAGVASEFVAKHLPAYLLATARPGTQELGFSFHTCLEENSKKILHEMKNFKSWVQGFSLTEHHPSEVSFVWMDFARMMYKNEDV